MPAQRKPADQRQDNRPERTLAVVPDVEVDAPQPQPGRKWRKATKESWEAFWSSEVAGALSHADRHALERLFTMRDLQQRAFDRYKADPYVDGSQGQPVANPELDNALKLERAIVALEDRIGLSPKARANLGIAFGQAKLTAAELNARARAEADEVTDGDDLGDWEAAN